MSLLYACLAVGSTIATLAASETVQLAFEDCWFEPGKDWPRTRCGVLKVPEDYSKQHGRQIELPFIVFKAKSKRKNSFPLVVAGGGGPGFPLGIDTSDLTNTEGPVWANWYYASIDAGRDLILIDNRGVGSARPRLDCIEVENAAMDLLHQKLERDELRKKIRQAYTACKNRLVEQNIDLDQYHILNAAKDIEQLRKSLRAAQFNIYGGSYGSRVALVYERLYPQSVRALILDSIFPQSIETYEKEPRRNYEAVMRVIDKCNKDHHCQRLVGTDLDKRLAGFLEQLDTQPLHIRAVNPIDNKLVDVTVTPQMFFDMLYMALYDGEIIHRIPYYLHRIIKGDREHLATLISEYYIAEVSVDSIDEGAYASYACFDEIPFVDFDQARDELTKYPLQHYSNELVFDHMEIMCGVWDTAAAPDDFRQTYKIDTPLLIFAGELDPVTPIELARPVIDSARRWWAAVWPDISHSVMSYSACSDMVAATFLGDPESDPFVPECARQADRTIQKD